MLVGMTGIARCFLARRNYLAETRNFDGTVYFIFQPAEEGGKGGEAMIKDGLFDQFDMKTVWGMHNWPGMDVGKIGVHSGACMAAADMFEIRITGSGGHAAIPDLTIDPIPCGAAIVQSLQINRFTSCCGARAGGRFGYDFRVGKCLECDSRFGAAWWYGAVIFA